MDIDYNVLVKLSKKIAQILGFNFEVDETNPCLTLENFFRELYRFLGGKDSDEV